MKLSDKQSIWLVLTVALSSLFIYAACQPATAPVPTLIVVTPTFMPSPRASPSPEPDPTGDCSMVERLPNDSVEAQQILEEFVQNFKEQHPTEYMGIAILDRVDRLGAWAVVQGSVSGDDRNILVLHRTSQGY